VSIEPRDLPPDALGDAKGLDAIRHKGRQFQARITEVHGTLISNPVVPGNWFRVSMALDVTMKEAGRVTMREICIYHVCDDRIDHEHFFFDMG
jgi:hypothetical protein